MLWNILFSFTLAQAQEKSAFEQSLERDTSVKSTESWVEIKGVRYRKYEFKNEHYYVFFKGPDSPVADIYCEPPAGADKERLVVSESQAFARSAGFVQLFHESCKSVHGNQRTDLRLDPAVGLSLPSGKNSRSSTHNSTK